MTSEYLARTFGNRISDDLVPNKVIVLLGPKRVGKTVLIKQIIEQLDEPYLLLNGEDVDARKQINTTVFRIIKIFWDRREF